MCVAILGCGDAFGSSDEAAKGSGFAPNPMAGARDGGLGGAAPNGGAGDGSLPPEVESEISFEQPQASERFVYAANPEAGSVAIIDAEKLTIQTLKPGDRPTFLTTLAGTDDAIVLNVGSDDASVIRNPDKGATTVNLPVVRGSNAIAVAPDGKHAVVYFNSALNAAGNDSGSFQDVTVLGLERDSDHSIDMTVGFRPRRVFFSNDSKRAFVITEDGVSILDFAEIDETGSGIARLVTFGSKLEQENLDVAVTPDGRYALARENDSSLLRLVTLADGKVRSLDLSRDVELPALITETDMDAGVDDDAGAAGEEIGTAAITDLDLSPSGSFAMAVVRNRGAVLRIPVPAGFDDPAEVEITAVQSEIIGSVVISPDEKHALLYTTAANEERMTIMDLDSSGSPRSIELRKAIEAVAISEDSATALVIHTKQEGNPDEAGIDPDTAIDRSFGYSVLRIATADVKLQVTASKPGAFAIVPDGSYLFVLFNAPNVRETQQVELKSFLVDTITLGSPPLSVGSVRAVNRVFVNQDHEDGRITFIDWTTLEVQTVTGFELNSRIRD